MQTLKYLVNKNVIEDEGMKLIKSDPKKGEPIRYIIKEGKELIDVELVYDTHRIGIFIETLGERLFRVEAESGKIQEIYDEF